MEMLQSWKFFISQWYDGARSYLLTKPIVARDFASSLLSTATAEKKNNINIQLNNYIKIK